MLKFIYIFIIITLLIIIKNVFFHKYNLYITYFLYYTNSNTVPIRMSRSIKAGGYVPQLTFTRSLTAAYTGLFISK